MANRLPFEILQQIFALSCPISYSITTPIVLPFHLTISHVCLTWRQAILGYPALWSNIDINANAQDFHTLSRTHALFQFALAASAPAMLSLSLRITSLWEYDIGAEAVLETAAWVSRRWRHVEIHIISRLFTGGEYDGVGHILCSVRDNIPHLESLALYTPCIPGAENIFHNAPSLRHVNGFHAYNILFKLPWSQLRTLAFTLSSGVGVTDILPYLSNLRFCTCLEVLVIKDGFSSVPPNMRGFPIVLPRVHTVESSNTQPFPILNLPSLRRLSSAFESPPNFTNPIAEMITRSNAILSTLICPHTTCANQQLANCCPSLLHLVSHTPRLYLYPRSLPMADVETLLEWLNDSSRFPQLESLNIAHHIELRDDLCADGVFAWVDAIMQARADTLRRVNIVVAIDMPRSSVQLAHVIKLYLSPSHEIRERLERGPCMVDISFTIPGTDMRHHVVQSSKREENNLPEELRDWEEDCPCLR
ncbi:hypothetical protein CYLTODRAFT_489567 [Cylindrobasidium torrendii FP15055 ss-10]|uniref:Uncharacterized protein n=1 Tax=Cylindrobasidium torrendii FP15055 ss-10 TaxID=1314674 RepID=A0A0D7BG72_9AGAR|nr:hypothetical protein CYLTODRAFT_489567 [Cylindrobasidium torrendii FP15055 ss-10]